MLCDSMFRLIVGSAVPWLADCWFPLVGRARPVGLVVVRCILLGVQAAVSCRALI